ncbi:MAG: type II toxin-antitoxin system VapC family toxin [Snowella sp.]|nr:type II toxin-antitoxin system VapC family toxin [Snowella sp.]
MKILLDTHTLLWFFEGNIEISQLAKSSIEDTKNQKLISIASVWEMSIKQSQNKLDLEKLAADYIADKLCFADFSLLPIQLNHLVLISTLPFHHRDPFDRLLISQSITENIPILSKDKAFDSYSVKRIWNEIDP